MNAVEKLAEIALGKFAHKIDGEVFRILKEQAPFSYWLISTFPYRWMGKLLRLELIQWRSPQNLEYKFKIKVWGRTIGKFVIPEIELINI